MQRTVLLNPGPVNVTPRVTQAMLRGDVCHREKEFEDLLAGMRTKLLKIFHLETSFNTVLLSGSGTAALEMAVSSCLSEKRSILIIQNGVYGERIGEIADCYGLKKHVISFQWGQLPNINIIESTLKSCPDIEVVAIVHHETTTGLLNPIKDVGSLTRRYKKKYLVDCISSIAGDEIEFENWGLSFCIGTANKCIQGLPGVSFVLFRKEETQRLAHIPSRSLYFDLYKNFASQENGIPLFTPSIQAHYAFDEALSELMEESAEKRIIRYREAAKLLREGFSKMKLKFLMPQDHFSNCLTSLMLPEGTSYSRLHSKLKNKGFIIYSGQGSLNQNIFRVANMGDIKIDEYKQFIKLLESCLPLPT